MRWSDLAVLVIFALPLAAQPIGGGIFGKMPTGTVTSVGLSASTPLQVSGSPITGSGTMSLSFQNQSANTVLAGPTSGGAAAPAFRALVAADIPSTSGLTTVGAVPFVTTPGTLGQDGALTFDSTGKKLTLSQGTLTTSNPALSATATWNAGGATFTHLLANVTDTASASGSLLLDLQVGGSTKIKIQKDGTIYGDSSNPNLVLSNASGALLRYGTTGYVNVKNGSVDIGNTTGLVSITGSVFTGNADNFYDLGASNKRWKNFWAIGLVSTGGVVGIGPSNTAPTGTLAVVDRTGVTGASLGYFGTDGTNTSATYSKWIFRLGAVQGSNNLTEWQSNAGVLMTGIAPNGGLLLTNTAAPTLANGQLTIHIVSDTQVTFTLRGSDGVTRTNTLTMI